MEGAAGAIRETLSCQFLPLENTPLTVRTASATEDHLAGPRNARKRLALEAAVRVPHPDAPGLAHAMHGERPCLAS